jgi:hypothetical protein
MATARLSYLDICILCWIYAEVQRSTGMLAASCHKLMRGSSIKEKYMISRTIANLGTRGLIVVGRSSGGEPEYLCLTAEGRDCLSQIAGFCYV